MIGLNLGSGQRRFESVDGFEWINVDKQSRPPDQVPDVLCDVSAERLPYEDASVDYVVLHHLAEHLHLGPEQDHLMGECHRVLKPGGQLLVFVPDMKALAQRWLLGQIDDYIYFVNVYGAWQGIDGDSHAWGWQRQGLWDYLKKWPYRDVHSYDWRFTLPGMSVAQDWWCMGFACVK